jgi:hypothetical protein
MTPDQQSTECGCPDGLHACENCLECHSRMMALLSALRQEFSHG